MFGAADGVFVVASLDVVEVVEATYMMHSTTGSFHHWEVEGQVRSVSEEVALPVDEVLLVYAPEQLGSVGLEVGGDPALVSVCIC